MHLDDDATHLVDRHLATMHAPSSRSVRIRRPDSVKTQEGGKGKRELGTPGTNILCTPV
jgi:hypothetical protein